MVGRAVYHSVPVSNCILVSVPRVFGTLLLTQRAIADSCKVIEGGSRTAKELGMYSLRVLNWQLLVIRE